MYLLSVRPIIDRQNVRMLLMLTVLTALTLFVFVVWSASRVVFHQFAPVATLADGMVIMLTAQAWDELGDLRERSPINPALKRYHELGIALTVLSTIMVVANAFAR